MVYGTILSNYSITSLSIDNKQFVDYVESALVNKPVQLAALPFGCSGFVTRQ